MPPGIYRSFTLRLGLFVVTLVASWLATKAVTPAANLVIYADTLATGWQDWSWDTTRNGGNEAPIHDGNRSYAVTYSAAWGGLYLHADPALTTASYTHLRFFIHGGAMGGQKINVIANGAADHAFAVTATANTWMQIDVPLTSLNNPATLSDLYWQDATGGAQPTYFLDDIVLLASTTATPTTTLTPVSTPIATPTLLPADVTLTINTATNRHPISELIYGLHVVADEKFVNEIALPIRRWGGNDKTRYNWEIGATNHASDWYFHNGKSYDPVTLAQMDADQWLQRNKRTGTASIITLPMTGYVAKDGDQQTCGFPAAKYPGQDDVDDEDGFPNCGNGRKNGAPIASDPLNTSRAVDETFVQKWVRHLQQNAATNGAVEFYNLDNEPDIWFETHRDIYPVAWKYDQFRDLTYRYAAAIKAVDANAKLLGPVVNGWTYYWHGSWDGQQQDWASPDDRNAHGGTPFVAWYLQQMKAYDDQHGVRLLDYLDLHYYPQNRANEAAISLAPAGDAATQARRLRSTRSLWDPTYVDESWIADAGPEGGIVKLLPRMNDWVTQNYPGTKLAITEYNWGGLESINGALAQADVLGIFGREGLDLATLFDPGQGDPLQTTFPSSPGAFAFRIYRNYDGLSSKFGATSIQATSSDQDKLSIYAAERAADGWLTVVVINKTAGALTAHVKFAGFTPAASAQVFRYAQDDLTRIVHLPDQPLGAAGFSANFPANSISLLVLPQGEPPTTLSKTLFLPMLQK